MSDDRNSSDFHKRGKTAVESLTPEQVESFREAFNLFDRRGQGYVTIDGIREVLEPFFGSEPKLKDGELEDILHLLDADGNGKVDFDEFLQVMAPRLAKTPLEEELATVFSTMDKDKNGFISPAELKEVLRDLGEPLTDDEFDALLNAADTDQDGNISYEEFVRMMKS